MLGKRLKEAREKAGYSQEELSKALSIGKRTLVDYEQDKTEPKLSILHKVADLCNVDIEWLLFDKKVSLPNILDDDVAEVDFIEDMVASAGGGGDSSFASSRKVKVSRFMLDEFRVQNPKRANLIKVFGDSMEPVFRSGDIAVVERVERLEDVKNGNIVIATINGDIYIKRIEKIPFKQRMIFKSENRLYADIVVEGSELESVKINSIVRGKLKVF